MSSNSIGREEFGQFEKRIDGQFEALTSSMGQLIEQNRETLKRMDTILVEQDKLIGQVAVQTNNHQNEIKELRDKFEEKEEEFTGEIVQLNAQVGLLKEKEADRKWKERTVWATILGLLAKLGFDLWTK